MPSSKRTEYEIALLVGGQVQASFGNSINTVEDGFETLASMAQTAAKVAAAAFGAVKIGQFVTDAIQTYSEFDQSMANTAAIANATQIEYEKLEAAARDMGKATTKTASEAADALGYMMLAGWDVESAIAGLEPVLRLSEATQMDLATCSDLVTDSMSALGLSVDDLSSYLDICTKANNSANTTAEALMEAFIGCGGAAKTVGESLGDQSKVLNDTATALGILANNGVKGAEAGTAMNSILVRMTSKDVAMNAMKRLGVSVFDTAGNFVGLHEVLLGVQKALSGLDAEKRAAYMSDIAGTNYYTEMSYLLDAVGASAAGIEQAAESADIALDGLGKTADKNLSSWDDLSGKLTDSEGALLGMADTVTDTLTGAFARLDSAVDDAKISFADAFSDDLKDTVNELSEYIPTLTEKFIDFSAKAEPKITSAFRTIANGAEKAWDGFLEFGSWAAEHSNLIEKMLKGIGSAIITYKVVGGLSSVANSIKGVSSAIKTMTITQPWLFGLTLAGSAITGIAAALKTARKQAEKSNLAEHFGDIALSMGEISQVADYITRNGNLSKIQESFAKFEELDGIQRNIQESIDTIDKMNWKVSIGMNLSEDENESYKAEIENYISSVQQYVQQQQYAMNINLAPFAEEDLERQGIVAQLNNFYSGKYEELEKLGTELNQVITDAFQDGLLELDEVKEITNLQAQMARIQESIATSSFEAKLKVMELQYQGGDLDAETFQALQEELNQQAEEAAAKYEETLNLRIASCQVMLDDKAIEQFEYDVAVNEFWEDYLDSMSELEAKTLKFQTNTLMQQYGDELGQFYTRAIQVAQEAAQEETAWIWEEDPARMWEIMAEKLTDSRVSTAAKDAMESLLSSMQPSIERSNELIEKYASLGKEASQELCNALSDTKILSAMTLESTVEGDDTDGIYYVLGKAIADESYYTDLVASLQEKDYYNVPEQIVNGMVSSMEEKVDPAADGIYAYSDKYIQETFASGFDVTADIDILLNPVYRQPHSSTLPELAAKHSLKLSSIQMLGRQNKTLPLPGHADGGIFHTPHIAWFAEDGPEAAIPLDGSSNAVSLWEKVGMLLGVLDMKQQETDTDAEKNNHFAGTGILSGSMSEKNTDTIQVIFSPQIHIEGHADEEVVTKSLRISMEEFREYMEEWLAERNRTAFS